MSASILRSHPMTVRAWMRGPGLLVAGLVAIGLLSFALGHFITPVSTHAGSTVVAERNLRFIDQPDGQVGVIDVADGSTVVVLGVGQDSFVRATMRGLAQQRLRAGATADLPFHLVAWADGRLTLEDPGTKRSIELESFGQTNEADFARMLPLQVMRTDGAVQ